MSSKFEKLNNTFNITPTEVEVDSIQVSVGVDKEKPDRLAKSDVERDYEYTRGNLYSIIEKGQEAINGILDVAEQSDMPRAYEKSGVFICVVSVATDEFVGSGREPGAGSNEPNSQAVGL